MVPEAVPPCKAADRLSRCVGSHACPTLMEVCSDTACEVTQRLNGDGLSRADCPYTDLIQPAGREPGYRPGYRRLTSAPGQRIRLRLQV